MKNGEQVSSVVCLLVIPVVFFGANHYFKSHKSELSRPQQSITSLQPYINNENQKISDLQNQINSLQNQLSNQQQKQFSGVQSNQPQSSQGNHYDPNVELGISNADNNQLVSPYNLPSQQVVPNNPITIQPQQPTSHIDKDMNNTKLYGLMNTGEIRADFNDNKECLGGAFFVNYNGIKNQYVITDNHVITDKDSKGNELSPIALTFELNSRFYDAKVVKIDVEHDLALLKLDSPVNGSIAMPILSQPEKGIKVITIGSPLGVYNTVTQGFSDGYQNINDKTYLQFTAPINPGNSGGPVLDQNGNIIGIVELKLVQGDDELLPGLAEATPSYIIENFLNN